MTQQAPIQRAGTGLPIARLRDVHDMLTLALDATEGSAPQNWQVSQARGYLRNTLRQVNRLIPNE